MKKNEMWKKISRVMKGTIFLMFFIVFGAGAKVYSQHEAVNLRMKDASLVNVFDRLEEMTGMKFLYNAGLVKEKGKIDVVAENKPINELLKEILLPCGLDFSFNGKQVVIRKAQSELPQQKAFTVKGRVTDRKGAPLPGATIRIDGTTIGTATDEKGMFSLTLAEEKGTLVFSFVGCKNCKLPFTAGKFMEVKMEDEASNLDEVTVIAYGQRNKRELISSISSVKAEDIKDVPVPSLETLLQGRMAGLGVNLQSGAPGSGGANVAIRGYNSLLDDESGFKSTGAPLYVIDGVPVHSFTSPITGTNTIAEIDPSTIESVEVLKDAASAAIYGSRAANGVILITTKKGKAGRGKFAANFSYTGAVLPEAPPQMGGRGERLYVLGMMKAAKSAYYDKAEGVWKYPASLEEAAANGADYNLLYGRGQGYFEGFMKLLQDSLNPFFNNSTNWYKYVFRPGKVLNANIQTSGGSENMNYLIGAGFYRETGIMPGSDFTRANFITNLSVKPIKNLTVDSRLYVAYTDRSRGEGGGAGGMYESLTVDPAYTSTLLSTGGPVEEKILQMMNGQVESNTSYRFRGNLQLGYEIIPGLNLSTSLALDFNQVNYNFFRPSYLDPTSYHESLSRGMIDRDLLVSNENLLNYNFSIRDKHNFDILLGFSYDANKMWSIGGEGSKGPSDDIQYVGSSFPDLNYSILSDEYRALQKYQSDFTETAMVSYFGRLAYNYDKKYLMEATLRRDGSSVFGKDVRWATFPSVAVGWAFSEEHFMRWAWWMNFAKFRASWGRTGSQFGIPYLAQGLMTPGSIFDGIQGMAPSGVVNHKLKWEESDQYDFGLDIDMFDYRVNLTIDYYYKYTRSLIHNVPLPGDMYGLENSQWRNAMAISNEGLELEAKVDIFRKTAVTWRTRFNISKNWNRFEKSFSGTDIPGGLVIGKSMSGIYLFKDGGIIQSEADIPRVYDEEGKMHYLAPEGEEESFFTVGMHKIEDLNGDGMITDDGDMFYAGSALPKAYGGWAHEVKWKDFDLNVLLTFTFGRNMVNTFTHSTRWVGGSGVYPVFAHPSATDYWHKAGEETTYPAPGVWQSYTYQYSGLLSSNLEKVHYCKLKQLTLGYNVPKKVMKKLHLDGIRLFVTGENLLTLTNYSGIDPEVVDIYSGMDRGTVYPLARKWTIGLTVNF